MKNNSLLLFLFVITSINCNKGIETDNQYIRGRLFLNDTITQNAINKPLSGKKVLLSLPSDSLNYIYSATTDADGYFSFALLANKQNDFIVSTNDTMSNGFFYKSRKEVKRGQTGIELTQSLDENSQNGFLLKTTDIDGNIIPEANVYLFNSLALAIQNNAAGAVETFQSTKEGKLYKLKLPGGVYYINAVKTVDTATFQQSLKQIVIPAKGILVDKIQLTRKITTYKNGVTIIVLDSLGGFIPNAQIYLYNSQVLAASNDPSAVFDSFTTDALGKKSKYDLPSGDYYINVNKVINDSLAYQSLINKVTLPINGFLTETIVLRKKQ